MPFKNKIAEFFSWHLSSLCSDVSNILVYKNCKLFHSFCSHFTHCPKFLRTGVSFSVAHTHTQNSVAIEKTISHNSHTKGWCNLFSSSLYLSLEVGNKKRKCWQGTLKTCVWVCARCVSVCELSVYKQPIWQCSTFTFSIDKML